MAQTPEKSFQNEGQQAIRAGQQDYAKNSPSNFSDSENSGRATEADIKGAADKKIKTHFKEKSPILDSPEKNAVDDYEGADPVNTPYHDLEMNGSISQQRSENHH